MNDQKRLRVRVAVMVLVQSVAWAVVMQVTAAALSGTGRFELISPWLLAAWFVMTIMPLTLLDLRATARAEWQCLRRAVRALRG